MINLNEMLVESGSALDKAQELHKKPLAVLWNLHSNIHGRRHLAATLTVLRYSVDHSSAKFTLPDSMVQTTLKRLSTYTSPISQSEYPSPLSNKQVDLVLTRSAEWNEFYSELLDRMDAKMAVDGYVPVGPSKKKRLYATGKCGCTRYSTCDFHAEHNFNRLGPANE